MNVAVRVVAIRFARETEAANQPEMRAVQIAIVDDSPIVRERLTQILTQHESLEVAWQAGDAPEAKAAFAQHAPHAVILDIHLPSGSGLEVLKAIKQAAPATRVIMLTNYPVQILRQRCLELGAEAFFDKSTEFHKVFEALGSIKTQAANRE
jgi:DNA-binding NarL/FixJ family response regulator